MKKILKKSLILFGIIVGSMLIYALGGITNPIVKAEFIKEDMAPVLLRIAKCESESHHYGKTGQVQINSNNNGTVDVGLYQINSVWFSKATQLGLDLTKETDNQKMAEWLYRNKGTGDWESSYKCWK